MITNKISLDVIQVASPCTAPWDEMQGDDRVRFCGQCHLNVYNLSEMPREEAQKLVANHEGRLCVRFYRRADGTVLTRDCPVGLRVIRMQLRKLVAATVAMFVALISGTFFGRERTSQPLTKQQFYARRASSPLAVITEWAESFAARNPTHDEHLASTGLLIIPSLSSRQSVFRTGLAISDFLPGSTECSPVANDKSSEMVSFEQAINNQVKNATTPLVYHDPFRRLKKPAAPQITSSDDPFGESPLTAEPTPATDDLFSELPQKTPRVAPSAASSVDPFGDDLFGDSPAPKRSDKPKPVEDDPFADPPPR